MKRIPLSIPVRSQALSGLSGRFGRLAMWSTSIPTTVLLMSPPNMWITSWNGLPTLSQNKADWMSDFFSQKPTPFFPEVQDKVSKMWHSYSSHAHISGSSLFLLTPKPHSQPEPSVQPKDSWPLRHALPKRQGPKVRSPYE